MDEPWWQRQACSPADGPYAIEGEADRILRAMSEYVKSTDEFSFHADIAYDTIHSTGEKVQYGGASDVSVRRPNRLHVAFEGDEYRRQVFYDGSTITLFDRLRNLYAVTKVPGKMDDALDLVFEKHGLSVPLADFVYADPHAVLTANAEYGSVIGVHGCADKRCHHLLFTQEIIDWEIWIETGPRPVPRKLVITYKGGARLAPVRGAAFPLGLPPPPVGAHVYLSSAGRRQRDRVLGRQGRAG